MACPQCKANPKAHNFVKFGHKANTGYWYTAAARAEELVDTPEKFGYFSCHMNEAKQDAHWVWVFDCGGMTNRHYTSIDFMTRLVGSLSNDHANFLNEIWVINPNMWMRAAVALMSPFLNKKLVSKIFFIEDAGIEFLYKLQGVNLYALPWKT
jgi:hypothetical protein